MSPAAVPLDRRHRRRLETIEQVLDHAVEIMSEEGVAGLSLGEIARRMGIRPPSIYVYFPSKNALYDAVFARGWQLMLDCMRDYDERHPPAEDDLPSILLRFGREFARWSVEHPAYAQLMYWRPVPGFEPSEESYRPAVELYARGRKLFAHLQERRLIRADADLEQVQRDWTVLVSGVISQQMANAPDEPFDHAVFVAALPRLTSMFAAYYGAAHARGTAPRTSAKTTRSGHAGKR